MARFIGTDIGGTFTDLVAFDSDTGQLSFGKVLTTPRDLVEGVMGCLAEVGIAPASVDVLKHGTTQVINTLLERKGARTALVKGATMGAYGAFVIGSALWHLASGVVPEARTMGAIGVAALVPGIITIPGTPSARPDPVGPFAILAVGIGIVVSIYGCNTVEGIGKDSFPETLDTSIVDEYVRVSDRDSFLIRTTRVRFSLRSVTAI